MKIILNDVLLFKKKNQGSVNFPGSVTVIKFFYRQGAFYLKKD